MLRSLVVAALFAAACSDDPPPDDGTFNCDQDTHHDELLIGTTKIGTEGRLSFKLLDYAPAPVARGFNDWKVEISTVSGLAPVTNATLDVLSYMPKHGHYGEVVTEITPMPTPGQYDMNPINFHMSGVWEVQLFAETDAGDDYVAFLPCLPF